MLGLATTAELFALVAAAARRGVEEVAVAAVVGSAVYNATVTLGAAAVVAPLASTGCSCRRQPAAALPLAVVRGGMAGPAGTGRRRGAGGGVRAVRGPRPGPVVALALES